MVTLFTARSWLALTLTRMSTVIPVPLLVPVETDFIYELLRDWWWHPETGVTIYAEDMPEELKPKENNG